MPVNPVEQELLDAVRDDWIRDGLSTEPADRTNTHLASRDAFASIDEEVYGQVVIWVQSPMAGVIASTSVGFAFGPPLKSRLMAPLEAALSINIPQAQRVRREVDKTVWHGARAAVHKQVAAELEARGDAWEASKREIGSYAWSEIYNEIGDPVYTNTGWWDKFVTWDGLFEENLVGWEDRMMEGQFGAGMMAQLDALDLLGAVDPEPFAGLRLIARGCGWWWAQTACVVFCERPAKVEVSGRRVTMEFRDGWRCST